MAQIFGSLHGVAQQQRGRHAAGMPTFCLPRRQKGVYLHCICVLHPDVCLRTLQSPWAARYRRLTLTLALPGQVRLKVRSIPVRDAAPCLNALEQKT